MSAIKMFSVAGCSTQAGEVKLRFANDSARVKVLAKNGHTDIDLLDLPREMSKIEIAEYFIEINFANGRVVVDELVAELLKKSTAPVLGDVKKQKIVILPAVDVTEPASTAADTIEVADAAEDVTEAVAISEVAEMPSAFVLDEFEVALM
jgi:hypothetical protein